jgi:hypothetical protein
MCLVITFLSLFFCLALTVVSFAWFALMHSFRIAALFHFFIYVSIFSFSFFISVVVVVFVVFSNETYQKYNNVKKQVCNIAKLDKTLQSLRCFAFL